MRVFALMLWGEAVFSYRSLPHWGRGTAVAELGYFLNGALEMIFSALFHPASALSAPTGHLPPRGEGFVRRYAFSTYACIRFDVMGEAVFSHRSLPHWGRGTASAVDRVLSLTARLR